MGLSNIELERRIANIEKKVMNYAQGGEPPTGQFDGQLFWDKIKNKLNVWNSTSWVGITGGGTGVSGSSTFATDINFVAIDFNTVSWGNGVVSLSDGSNYNVIGGNTGNMTASLYIYIDTSTSLISVSTTPAGAIGSTKILICVATPNTNTLKNATFQSFGNNSKGVYITANEIASQTITANEIASNTITIGNTDGSIESPSGAQTKVNTLTNSLGVLAYDNLVSAAKLDSTVISGGYIKTTLINATDIFAQNITATGTITGATLNGGSITGSTIKTKASGQRVELGNYLGTDVLAFFNSIGTWSGTLYGFTGTYGATINANNSSFSADNIVASGGNMICGGQLSITGGMGTNITMNNHNINGAFNISTTNLSSSLITTSQISNNNVQGNPVVVTGGYVSNTGIYTSLTSGGAVTFPLGSYNCNISGVTHTWLTN